MAAPPVIPELDRAGLRQFAIVTGALLVVLFGLALPWLFGFGYPNWPWMVAAALIAWGVVAPQTLRPVYRGWMRFGLLMNRITTPLILGLVFFIAITPLALVMKVIGRDTMRRRFDPDTASYRIPSVSSPKEKMEKPF